MDDGFFVVVSPPVYSAPKVRKLPITTLVVFNDKGFRGAKSQSSKCEVDFECPYRAAQRRHQRRRTQMRRQEREEQKKRMSVMRAQKAHLEEKYGKNKKKEKKQREDK